MSLIILPAKILTIQNASCETLGTLAALFESDGFQVSVIQAQRDHIPRRPNDYDAVVILGGPMAVYDNLPYLRSEQALIRNAIDLDLPVLGICLGSQLIAAATGGRVFKGQKKEIGWHSVYITPASSNDIFRGITEKKIDVFQWHGDTYELPPEAKILAYTDLYPQAFRVGSAVGIQFHLEVNEVMVQAWINEYRPEVTAANIKPESLLRQGDNNIEKLYTRCKLVYSNFTKVLR